MTSSGVPWHYIPVLLSAGRSDVRGVTTLQVTPASQVSNESLGLIIWALWGTVEVSKALSRSRTVSVHHKLLLLFVLMKARLERNRGAQSVVLDTALRKRGPPRPPATRA